MDTAEQTVEEARQLLNRRVEELQRDNGINEHSDLSIAAAVRVIQALSSHGELSAVDRLAINAARWHDSSLLSAYLNSQSPEFQRDLAKYGVYTIFELMGNKQVPLFVEALPRYVGMSTVLSSRLKQHALGAKNSNPADHVTQEYLLAYATEAERAAYAIASIQEQVEIRRLCMSRRQLWVRVAHTRNKAEADRLEHAMIRLYVSQGFHLWNTITYSTGT
jgi:hypothetical protein